MKVSQIMRQPVISMHEDDTLEEAARVMLENELRGIPVINKHGKICGFLSVSDYLAKEKVLPFSRFYAPQLFGKWIGQESIEKIYKDARTIPVKEIMSTKVISVSEDDPIDTVIELMVSHHLNRIPVLRDGVPVGILARYDLLRLILRADKSN